MTIEATSEYAGSSDRIRSMVVAALLAAMMAATSWIAVPLLGPVPVTLQTAFVLLAGLLLSPGWAAASMCLYLALGVAGLPVFAQGQAGFAAILGPTGGFLLAFPFAAAATSLVFRALERHRSRLLAPVVAVVVGEIVMYAIGVPWLMAQTGLSLGQAVVAAVVPFLIPDAIKATFAVVIALAVKRAVPR